MARLPAGRDDFAGDELPAGAGGDADRDGRLQGGARVVLPDCAPGLLHGRPAAAALLELDRRQVAVAGLVLHENREVVRVGASVHPEGDVHPAPVARHPACQ